MKIILVLNAGSSSLKYQVFDMENQQVLVGGLLDRIGEAGAEMASHQEALARIMLHLQAAGAGRRFAGSHW